MKPRTYDPVRRKSVRALPEEHVRLHLVEWLVREAGVPPRLIAVEYSLSNLDPRSRKRADVVVWRPVEASVSGAVAEKGGLRPWLLAECKAPGVALTEVVADQVRRYAAKIRADHVLITNGIETRCFQLANKVYEGSSNLPRFPGSSKGGQRG
jgi:hypothetical protein